MKKSIISLAVAAMALIAPATIMAKTSEKATTEQKAHQPRKDNRQPRLNPFADLNLTDAQKTQIEALGSPVCKRQAPARQCRANCKPENCKNETCKSGNSCNQQNCNPGNNCKAQRGCAKGSACSDLKDYLAKVKQILTPEQYTKFLENTYVNRPHHKGHGYRAFKGKGMKHKHDRMKNQARGHKRPGCRTNA